MRMILAGLAALVLGLICTAQQFAQPEVIPATSEDTRPSPPMKIKVTPHEATVPAPAPESVIVEEQPAPEPVEVPMAPEPEPVVVEEPAPPKTPEVAEAEVKPDYQPEQNQKVQPVVRTVEHTQCVPSVVSCQKVKVRKSKRCRFRRFKLRRR